MKPGRPKERHCLVCGDRLGILHGGECCVDISCSMVLKRRAQLGERMFAQYLAIQSQQLRTHKARVRTELQRRQQLAEDLAQEEAEHLRRLDPAAYPPARYLRLVLPTGPGRDRKLAAARRQRYLAHVEGVIAEALAAGGPAAAPSPPSPPETSPDHPLAGRLCGLCGGGCCTRGGDTAYLSMETMQRVMAQQPSWSPGLLLAAYTEALRPRSRVDSCIHHHGDGCGLPRELRSDICNRYACAALTELQQRAAEPQALSGVLVLQRRQDQWQKNRPAADNPIVGRALLRESGVEPWPRDDAESPP